MLPNVRPTRNACPIAVAGTPSTLFTGNQEVPPGNSAKGEGVQAGTGGPGVRRPSCRAPESARGAAA